MLEISAPQDLLSKLESSQLFIDWKKEHTSSFLSHFFCQVNSELKAITGWQIGFFNESGKMSVFEQVNGNFLIKPEDEVFKKEDTALETLDINDVKKTTKEAVAIFQEKFKEFFPTEQTGDGFLILQTLNKKALWNFTFISKTIKFLNIKINATSGEVEDHQVVELVAK